MTSSKYRISRAVLSTILAAVTAYGLYLTQILKNFPGLSLGYLLKAGLIFVLLFYFNQFYLLPRISNHRATLTPTRAGVTVTAVALLLAIIYPVFLRPAYGEYVNPMLQPLQTVEVRPAAGWDPAISLIVKDVTNSYANISLDDLTLTGRWERTDENLLVLQEPSASDAMHWQGRPGRFLKLAFASADGSVDIYLNGAHHKTFDLSAGDQHIISTQLDFADTWYERFSTQVTLRLSALILSLSVWLLMASMFSGSKAGKTRTAWVWYAVPPLVTWTVTFLNFYPGIYSPDSVSHMSQAAYGNINTWHSVLYTLVVRASMMLFWSPVPVIVAQYSALALLSGWFIGKLAERSPHRSAPWLASLLLALAPPANLTVISLWKDVPYALAVVALTAILYRIVDQDRRTPLDLPLLVLVGAAIVLFRDNGLFIPFAAFVALAITLRRWRLPMLVATLSVAAILWLFTGPIYKILQVEDARKSYMVITHYVWPYLQTPESLPPEERAFFTGALPEGRWGDYDCATVNSLIFWNEFNADYMSDHQAEALGYLITHLRQDLRPAYERTKCVSEMIWRIPQNNYLYLGGHDGWSDRWVFDNDVGLETRPVNDWLLRHYYDPMLRLYSQHTGSWLYTLMWRPAVYLYLVMLLVMVLVYRRDDWRYGLIAVPAVTQSITLILTTIAQDFRYQFPVYVLAFLLLPVLFTTIRPVAGSQTEDRLQ